MDVCAKFEEIPWRHLKSHQSGTDVQTDAVASFAFQPADIRVFPVHVTCERLQQLDHSETEQQNPEDPEMTVHHLEPLSSHSLNESP